VGGGRSGATCPEVQRPEYVTGCHAPWNCVHRSSGYRLSGGTIGRWLERPNWLVWLGGVYASSGASRYVLLPSWGLGHGGSSQDACSSLHPLPSCEAPFLMGSGAEESISAFARLIGSPATSPAYAAPTSL
jgi:hypothetical protein